MFPNEYEHIGQSSWCRITPLKGNVVRKVLAAIKAYNFNVELDPSVIKLDFDQQILLCDVRTLVFIQQARLHCLKEMIQLEIESEGSLFAKCVYTNTVTGSGFWYCSMYGREQCVCNIQ